MLRVRPGVPVSAATGKHTPGPWTTDGRTVLWDADPVEVVCTIAVHETHGREVADANLIAAAPELLEAARHLSACDFPDEVDFRCEGCNKARAAIAKATGGQP